MEAWCKNYQKVNTRRGLRTSPNGWLSYQRQWMKLNPSSEIIASLLEGVAQTAGYVKQRRKQILVIVGRNKKLSLPSPLPILK